ncbi:Beta-galactosidase 8 [Castilleja foliolosa]|uniref:Beta-galactosidase 8 n=1 Tax=Castilleja foliolosa TaxID=1961234 RepID=A0ABD3D9Z6_9LAMI
MSDSENSTTNKTNLTEATKVVTISSSQIDRILKYKPEITSAPPQIEEAYVAVCHEATRSQVMNRPEEQNTDHRGIRLAVRSHGKNRTDLHSQKPPKPRSETSSRNRPGSGITSSSSPLNLTATERSAEKIEMMKLRCNHCGKNGHLKSGCFDLNGYPSWWKENPKYKKGTAAAATGGHPPNGDHADKDGARGFFGFTMKIEGLNGDGRSRILGAAQRNKGSGTNCKSCGVKEAMASFNRSNVGNERTKQNVGLKIGNGPKVYTNQLGSLDFDPPGNGPGIKNPGPHNLSTKIQHARTYKIEHEHSLFAKIEKLNKKSTMLKENNSVKTYNRFNVLSDSEITSGRTYISKLRDSKEKTSEWLLDSGATNTMTYDRKDIFDETCPHISQILTANGGTTSVESAGKLKLTSNINISHCLFIPALTCKLLSVSQVTKELNCMVLMYPNFCILQDILTKRIIGRGTERNGLYYINEVSPTGSSFHTKDASLSWKWHRRLGHPSPHYFKTLFPHLPLPEHCTSCILAKSHRTHFSISNTRSNEIFEIIHSDVWGPVPNNLRKSFSYFVLFIDDCTRMTWVSFLKQKSEVVTKFIQFHKMILTQYNKKIKILRSDNGGEFLNEKMRSFFQENGLIHQTSCPNTPQQNGIAERKNRTILEKTRALLFDSGVPTNFWPEAVATSVYLLNRLPTKILDFKTPSNYFQTMTDKIIKPSLPPKIFGCTVFVHIPKSNRSKLDPCALKCVFLGYGNNQKGYRCYHPPTGRLYVTMDCNFLETDFYFQNQTTGQGETQQSDPLVWLSETKLPEPIITIDPATIPDNERMPVQSDAEAQHPLPETPQRESGNEVPDTNIDSVTSLLGGNEGKTCKRNEVVRILYGKLPFNINKGNSCWD